MILSYLILGFITSFLGYLPPSMLTITASKITLQRNKSEAKQFIFGVSLVVVFQVFISILLVSYFKEFSTLIVLLKKIAVVVFIVISLFFTYKGFYLKADESDLPKDNSFLLGLTLSLVNMFAIPFFVFEYDFYITRGFVLNNVFSLINFTVGTVLGVYMVLNSYVFVARKYRYKLLEKVKYFNFFIGLSTGLIAVYSAIMLYF